MVIYGVKCIVTKQGGHDLYGEKVAGASFPERCAVVKLETEQHGSTVRVDSGATRGGAEEARAHAVLLMKKTSKIEVEDTVQVHGITLRVMKKRLRFNVAGKLDHFQIEAEIEQ